MFEIFTKLADWATYSVLDLEPQTKLGYFCPSPDIIQSGFSGTHTSSNFNLDEILDQLEWD